MSWWNLELSKSSAASWECFVCHCGQYRSMRMSNINSLWELTIVIPRPPYLVRMANVVSISFELVYIAISASVNSSNIMMWAFGTSDSQLSLSHVWIDGEVLGDKQYIWFQGCQSPQFRSGYKITTKECVYNFSSQSDISSQHSLKPRKRHAWFQY
jgi:hypothetical protein